MVSLRSMETRVHFLPVPLPGSLALPMAAMLSCGKHVHRVLRHSRRLHTQVCCSSESQLSVGARDQTAPVWLQADCQLRRPLVAGRAIVIDVVPVLSP